MFKHLTIEKEWLYNKYINEELSIAQIAEGSKISSRTVRRWLNNYNISIRSKGEGRHIRNKKNHCDLSPLAIEWINGELLGDGCIQQSTIYSVKFGYSSKYKEYIEYVRDTLKSFGIKQAGKINEYHHKKMDCYSYHYCSLCYSELMPIYKKWYPNGKKTIPQDIRLTPITLRQHYIGDGCLTHKYDCRPYIHLATCGFSILGVEMLVKQLIELGINATRVATKNAISIPVDSTKAFLNYIGRCPVKCYQYKWAY